MSFLAEFPYFYLSLPFAALGYLGLGRELLPGPSPWRHFLAGLLAVAAVAGSLAWTAPLLIIPFARAAILAGWLALGWRAWRGDIRLPAVRFDGRTAQCAVLAALLGLAFTLRFHFSFVGLGEEPYFLSPIVEFFQADYLGPLRSPAYYPWEVPATHILPPAVLAIVAALLPKGTMLQAIEIRFLLLLAAFGRFTYLALRRSKPAPVWSAAVTAAALLVFHREIDTCVSYSTFLYIILILEVGVIVFWESDARDRAARDILFLLLAMVMGKTSIFYLPALAFVWVALRFPRQAFHPTVIFGALAAAAQILTVAGRPKPLFDVSIKLTLANPFGGRPGLDYYPSIGDALINETTVSRLFNQHYAVGIIAVLMLVAVKYWLVPVRAADRLAEADPGRREIYRVAEVFLMIALAGWVLIRHDQHGVSHQIWVIVATAPLVLAAVLRRALAPGAWSWPAGLFALAALALVGGYNPWQAMIPPAANRLGGVAPTELARMSDAQAIARRPGEADGDYCMRQLLFGHRLHAGTVSRECGGWLGSWAIEPGGTGGGR